MRGGTGTDTFIFGPGFGNDRILDFDANPKMARTSLTFPDSA
jgi:hypothetical protein